jgi:hypothetical protein
MYNFVHLNTSKFCFSLGFLSDQTKELEPIPLERFSDQFHFSEYSTVGTVPYLIVQIIISIKKYQNSGTLNSLTIKAHKNIPNGRLTRKTSVSDPHWF